MVKEAQSEEKKKQAELKSRDDKLQKLEKKY